QILTWVQANPMRSSGDILRELQSLFPGRYKVSHLRTLQRGIRKIRTQVLQMHERARSPEGLQGNLRPSGELKPTRPAPESLASSSPPASVGTPSPNGASTRSSDRHQIEEPLARTVRETKRAVAAAITSSKSEPGQIARRSATVTSQSAHQTSSPEKGQRLTIERAILEYLQAHRTVGHHPKTLEWHQMVLS